MTNIIINTDPVKSEHVTWLTKDLENGSISLIEIVKNYYIHPDSNNHAYICQLEEKVPNLTFKRIDIRNISHILQLENALNIISKLEKETYFEKENLNDY